MATAACDVGDAQVARVDEANEVRRFMVEQRVRAHGIARGAPDFGEARGDMSAMLDVGRRIAAVAIDAAEIDGRLFVRIDRVLVAFEAASALDVGLSPGLLTQLDARCVLAMSPWQEARGGRRENRRADDMISRD